MRQTIEERENAEIQAEMTYEYELWLEELEAEKTLDKANEKKNSEQFDTELK
jgi:hypothetical protein